MLRYRMLSFWLPFVLVSMTTAQEPSRRPMTVDDALDLVQVANPQISPDGRRVLYAKSTLNWKENKRDTRHWMVAADGGDPVQFLSGENDSDPAWSPDGRTIAFLSAREKDSKEKQIYLIRADGGESVKLSEHKDGVKSLRWSPDGKSILFVADEARTDEQKKAEKDGEDAIAVDEGPNGQTRGRWNELWRIDIETRKEKRVTTDKIIIGDYEPSPDGSRVACAYRTENERNSRNLSEIGLVDLDSGRLTRITENKAPEGGIRWSPDGRFLAFTAAGIEDWDLRLPKIWILDVSSRDIRLASGTFEGSISDYAWSADQKSILFESQNRTFRNLFRLDLATGVAVPVTSLRGSLNLSSYSADRTRAAGVYSDPASPAEVFLVEPGSGATRPLTRSNPQVERFLLARAEIVTWKSSDGVEIEGILHLPPGRKDGTRVPLILNIHGGPAGVFSYGFSPMYHIYAGMGFASLSPNVRGSSGYSDELLRGNMYDLGGGDYRDLMTGVDALIERGIADPERLGVKGWSYGGILGGWTITRTHRFRAASLGAMVTDWASEYAMGFNHDVRLWYVGGTPWDNPGQYRELSSYSHIHRVQTPTILFHGENDTTDTIGQSMMFYTGLKDRGIPVRFLRYPREGHSLREPRHQRSRDVEEIAWMNRHILNLDWKSPGRPEEVREEKPTETEATIQGAGRK